MKLRHVRYSELRNLEQTEVSFLCARFISCRPNVAGALQKKPACAQLNAVTFFSGTSSGLPFRSGEAEVPRRMRGREATQRVCQLNTGAVGASRAKGFPGCPATGNPGLVIELLYWMKLLE